MEKRQLDRLESSIKQLCEGLDGLPDRQQFFELLRIIHQPGWTTFPEALLIQGLVDAMTAQAHLVSAQKKVLFEAASKVGLNPQPLPPGARPQ